MSPLFILAAVLAIALGTSSIRFWPKGLLLLLALAIIVSLAGTVFALAVDPLAQGGDIDWSRAPRAIGINFCVALIWYGIGSTGRWLKHRLSK